MKNNRWVAKHYGSRRGFLRTIAYRLLYLLGKYRDCRKIDWESVERLVFVCKGNICRSAYAEAYARSIGVEAISCGLQTIEGAPANAEAIHMAQKMGIDLEAHRTTPIMYLILRKTDLLVAMEPNQAKFLQNNMGRDYQCTLLGIWARPIIPYIHDPYGAIPAYFEKCFSTIKKSVHGIAQKTLKE